MFLNFLHEFKKNKNKRLILQSFLALQFQYELQLFSTFKYLYYEYYNKD